MIYDEIKQIKRYLGVHPNLDKALSFIQKTDLSGFKLGTYEVDGKDVFFFIQDNTTDKKDDFFCEYHKQYMDIHLILEGIEKISYGIKTFIDDLEFDDSKDIGFVSADQMTSFELKQGYFIAFYPEEFHQPNRFVEEQNVHKCVFKVKI